MSLDLLEVKHQPLLKTASKACFIFSHPQLPWKEVGMERRLVLLKIGVSVNVRLKFRKQPDKNHSSLILTKRCCEVSGGHGVTVKQTALSKVQMPVSERTRLARRQVSQAIVVGLKIFTIFIVHLMVKLRSLISRLLSLLRIWLRGKVGGRKYSTCIPPGKLSKKDPNWPE